MKTDTNIILKEVFEIRLDKKELAHELQEKISSLSRNTLQRILDRVIEQNSLPNYFISIKHLDIDLGDIPYKDLTNELPLRLERALTDKLFKLRLTEPVINKGDLDYTKVTKAESDLETLATFLIEGTTLVGEQEQPKEKVRQLIDILLQQQYAELIRLLQVLVNNDDAIARFVNEVTTKTWKALLAKYQATLPKRVDALIKTWYAIYQRERIMPVGQNIFALQVRRAVLDYLLRFGSNGMFDADALEMAVIAYISRVYNVVFSSALPTQRYSVQAISFLPHEVLRYYLNYGFLPASLTELGITSLDDYLAAGFQQVSTRNEILAMLQQTLKAPLARKRLAAQFKTDVFEQILMVLTPQFQTEAKAISDYWLAMLDAIDAESINKTKMERLVREALLTVAISTDKKTKAKFENQTIKQIAELLADDFPGQLATFMDVVDQQQSKTTSTKQREIAVQLQTALENAAIKIESIDFDKSTATDTVSTTGPLKDIDEVLKVATEKEKPRLRKTTEENVESDQKLVEEAADKNKPLTLLDRLVYFLERGVMPVIEDTTLVLGKDELLLMMFNQLLEQEPTVTLRVLLRLLGQDAIRERLVLQFGDTTTDTLLAKYTEVHPPIEGLRLFLKNFEQIVQLWQIPDTFNITATKATEIARVFVLKVLYDEPQVPMPIAMLERLVYQFADVTKVGYIVIAESLLKTTQANNIDNNIYAALNEIVQAVNKRLEIERQEMEAMVSLAQQQADTAERQNDKAEEIKANLPDQDVKNTIATNNEVASSTNNEAHVTEVSEINEIIADEINSTTGKSKDVVNTEEGAASVTNSTKTKTSDLDQGKADDEMAKKRIELIRERMAQSIEGAKTKITLPKEQALPAYPNDEAIIDSTTQRADSIDAIATKTETIDSESSKIAKPDSHTQEQAQQPQDDEKTLMEKLQVVKQPRKRDRPSEWGKVPSYPLTSKKGVEEPIFVANAGLVLLGPFIPFYFKALDLLQDGIFKDNDSAHHAVHLLQYIATGETEAPEYLLPLNKILCGVPLSEAIEREFTITERERDEADRMMKAALNNWDKMKHLSPAVLRDNFLKREGRILESEMSWDMKVKEEAIDILIDTLPWSYGTLKYKWMGKILNTEWK